jgi:hypothetical protein
VRGKRPFSPPLAYFLSPAKLGEGRNDLPPHPTLLPGEGEQGCNRCLLTEARCPPEGKVKSGTLVGGKRTIGNPPNKQVNMLVPYVIYGNTLGINEFVNEPKQQWFINFISVD